MVIESFEFCRYVVESQWYAFIKFSSWSTLNNTVDRILIVSDTLPHHCEWYECGSYDRTLAHQSLPVHCQCHGCSSHRTHHKQWATTRGPHVIDSTIASRAVCIGNSEQRCMTHTSQTPLSPLALYASQVVSRSCTAVNKSRQPLTDLHEGISYALAYGFCSFWMADMNFLTIPWDLYRWDSTITKGVRIFEITYMNRIYSVSGSYS